VLAGLSLVWLADSLLWALVWGYYEVNWPEPLRLLWLVIYQIVLPPVLSGLIGFILARKSRGHEMSITITLSLAVAVLQVASRFHHWHFQGRPPGWSLLFLGSPGLPVRPLPVSVAILVGGMIACKLAHPRLKAHADGLR
jgi:hypothetical protein